MRKYSAAAHGSVMVCQQLRKDGFLFVFNETNSAEKQKQNPDATDNDIQWFQLKAGTVHESVV